MRHADVSQFRRKRARLPPTRKAGRNPSIRGLQQPSAVKKTYVLEMQPVKARAAYPTEPIDWRLAAPADSVQTLAEERVPEVGAPAQIGGWVRQQVTNSALELVQARGQVRAPARRWAAALSRELLLPQRAQIVALAS